MMTERQVQEIVSRCLGIMAHFQEGERSGATNRRMIAGVEAVSREVMGLGLTADGMGWLILRPVSTELVARYGHELGPRLNAEFLAAFDALIPAVPNPDGMAVPVDHLRPSPG